LATVKIISPKGEFYPGALNSKTLKKMAWLSIFRCLHLKDLKFHATSSDESLFIKKLFPSFSVDLARDIPSSKKDFKKGKLSERTTFKAVFISRIDPKKNLIFIPEILAGIESSMEIDIWGEINDESYFKACIKEFSKLHSNICWKYMGILPLNQSSIKFQEYDLFIFPTKGENFGYVILESLQCGCPILLSEGTTPWGDLEENNVGYNLSLSNKYLWIERLSEYIKLDSAQRMFISSCCSDYAKSRVNLPEIEDENQNLFTK
jgi:glycosyltransferase involved in cell wall biosynthesis